MPLFRYKALSANGAPLTGEMDATSSEAVIRRLNDLGHLPISAEQIVGQTGGGSKGGIFRRGVTTQQLALVTRELSRLIGAGVPLERALEILSGVAESADVRRMVEALLTGIRGGQPLADAMEAHGAPFTRMYTNMIRAGEAGGTLDEVLAELSDYMARARELANDIVSALTYPALLLCVSVLSIGLLLTFVVPQFETLFAGAGAALPTATRVVIAVAGWFQQFWWVLLLVLLVGLLGVPPLLRRPGPRHAWHRVVLTLPRIGMIVRKMEVARFCRTLGTLMANGVSMLPALVIVGEAAGNSVLARSIGAIADSLKAGTGLSDPLAQGGFFPRIAVDMVRVGEEAGRLETMLLEIADIFEQEARRDIRAMLTLLEPLLILTLGVLIGGIIVSLFLAILSVNDLAI